MAIRILIVDDNPTFVAAVRQFLDFLPGAGIVGHARSAEDGLASARRLKPDLVLIDAEIPGMHGLALAREMRSWDAPPEAMLLSMHEVSAYEAPARSIGMLGLAIKSDFVSELLPAIEALAIAGVRNGMAGDATHLPA